LLKFPFFILTIPLIPQIPVQTNSKTLLIFQTQTQTINLP
jgi:hypothetical protein